MDAVWLSWESRDDKESSMSAETKTVADLEELLSEEIPCGGIDTPPITRSCDRAAVLRYAGHRCVSETMPAEFKCVECWQIFYSSTAQVIARYGWLSCSECDERFYSVESFADYRPF